jgi:hypothetical protein
VSARLQGLVESLERDPSLRQPERWRERLDALDTLEHHLVFGASPQDGSGATTAAALHGRTRRLCGELERANRELCASIRERIRNGHGATVLREWTLALAADDDLARPTAGDGYDPLDTLLGGVLQFDEPGAGIAELAPDMVFYQPTPARHVVELIERAGLTARDVLIDLGSGLGHVPLLAAAGTPARCIGIEQEAVYVDCAQRCAAALGLTSVDFVRQDVRAADLSGGTVFHMYTPFTGAMLDEVLGLLRQQACTREIRLFTLGPCTPVVAAEPWLERIDPVRTDRPVLFRSRPR